MSIRFTVEDHVARVTIDRPDRMNAIDEASEAELMRIWATIEKDDSVRCVVLTGAGDRAFCTGRRHGPAASAAWRCARHSTCR